MPKIYLRSEKCLPLPSKHTTNQKGESSKRRIKKKYAAVIKAAQQKAKSMLHATQRSQLQEPLFPTTSWKTTKNMRKENRSTKNYFSTLPTDFTDLKWNNFSRLERLTWLQIHKPFYFKWRFPLPTREFWTSTNIKNSVWNLKKWRSFFFLVFLINCCSFSCVIPSYIFDRSFLYIQFSIYIPHNHIKTYTISW